MKYLFIPVRGPLKILNSPVEGEVPDYHFFLEAISANHLEVVHCSTNYRHLMLLDECGKILEPPKEVNYRASALYGGAPYDLIVGDVLLGKEGYTPDGVDVIGLSDEEIKAYLRLFFEE